MLHLALLAASILLAQADDTKYFPCPLEGLRDGKVTADEPDDPDADGYTLCLFDGAAKKGCLAAKGALNLAKTDVECKGAKISVASQRPFSAMSTIWDFAYAKGALTLTGTRDIDPSADMVRDAEAKLAKGDVAGAAALYGEVMYPDHYFQPDEVWTALLLKARAQADAASKKHDFRKAADAMRPAAEYRDLGDAGKGIAKAAGALNDYGYFLDEAGDHARAEQVLAAVVGVDPERAVAYLNWGDALFAQKKDAAPAYAQYGKRVARAKWPKRVGERCGAACARLR